MYQRSKENFCLLLPGHIYLYITDTYVSLLFGHFYLRSIIIILQDMQITRKKHFAQNKKVFFLMSFIFVLQFYLNNYENSSQFSELFLD